MARGALDAARAAGAEQYASESFNAANSALEQANDAVSQRDYRLALARALDAHERAQEAARDAADGKARARTEAELAVVAASTAVQNLRQQIKAAEAAKVPAKELKPARTAVASAEKTLQEARAALKATEYRRVQQLVEPIPAAIAKEIEALGSAAKKPAPPARRSR